MSVMLNRTERSFSNSYLNLDPSIFLNLSKPSPKLLHIYIERTHFRISLLKVFSLGLVRNQNMMCAGLLFHSKPNTGS